jgi:uncharacterized membrane protein
VIVAILTVATFVVRLTQIHQSLFGDEVFTYQDILGRTLPQVVANVHTGAENSPPLFFILAYATAKLGDPTVWIRLPSIVFGAAILPVIYAIGRDTVGRVPGTIAAAIVALSPFSMYYGVEARPYATMAFFTALSTWALLRAVDRRGRRYWALYVVAAVLACYSHYTCAFVLVVQGAWSLWVCRDRIIEPAVSHVAVLVLYIPWFPYLRGKALAVIGLLEPLTVHNVLIDAARPIAGYPYAPLRSIPTYLGLGALIACALVGLAILTRAAAARGPLIDASDWPRRFWLLVAVALANPVLLLLYSLVSTDLWIARNLYASVPAQALVLASVVAVPNRRIATALTTIVVAVLVVGLVRSISPSWQRPPYGSIATYLDAHAAPNDPIEIDSFVGPLSIQAMFDRPHTVTSGATFMRDARHTNAAFVQIDTDTSRRFQIPLVPPPPPGMHVARVLRYHGAIFPGTKLIVYRHAAAAR